jgi:lipopolysaccharide export system permease protein
MIAGTLSRYFGLRFLGTVFAIFVGMFALVAMIDFVEMLRRSANINDVSALFVAKVTLYRVPYLTERALPFAVMAGAMYCYLNLSRRLELVIARSAGVSAWQFVAPAIFFALMIGIASTGLYNPLSASWREESNRLESELFGRNLRIENSGGGYWIRQKTDEGQAIINAKSSSQQGASLAAITIFKFDQNDGFVERIEAKSALLKPGFWQIDNARIYRSDAETIDRTSLQLKTTLTAAQVGESLATPDTVPFWQLSNHIRMAENAGLAAAGYRVQYYQLLAQPFYLVAMVILAASVSLRSLRFGGVQRMVLGGIVLSFLLYVMGKVTGDLSKAGVMPPIVAASLPPLLGGLTGLITLLYQEDG